MFLKAQSSRKGELPYDCCFKNRLRSYNLWYVITHESAMCVWSRMIQELNSPNHTERSAKGNWNPYGLVGGLEHQFYFPIYWVANHPNWRSHIFQRGFSPTTNQWRCPEIGLPLVIGNLHGHGGYPSPLISWLIHPMRTSQNYGYIMLYLL